MKKIINIFDNDIFKLSLGIFLFSAALISDMLSFFISALILYIAALVISGYSVYIDAVKGILRRDFLDEKFLMSIASIGAMIIGEYREGVAVMLFFMLGEMFEHKAVSKSRKKIRSLMDICPDEATVIRDGAEITVDADEVEVGETMVIRAGERAAVDAEVLSGFADADTSAITGESVPRPLSEGSKLDGGTIVINGLLYCKVLKKASDSAAKRILDMVENATENKSKEENFITVFSRVYTPIVVTLALFLALLPPIFGIMLWSESVYRALIFLVISCPCALVISVPMAFFGGIGAAASGGILFKGGNFFAPVAKTKTVAFDKTGTLTNGKFRVKGVVFNKIPKEELLSVAAGVEYGSNHPIAVCLRAASENPKNAENISEIAGKGTIGYIDGKKIGVGNKKLMSDIGITVPNELEDFDESLVFCGKEGDLLGAIIISDTVKPEAAEAMEALRRNGVQRTLMLSGDKEKRAEAVGKELGVDEIFASLMPEDKYEKLKNIINCESGGGKVMYVGDGINDAPSLALADVGVAMGAAGSDSAIESADLVIMSDDLKKLPEAIKIARKTLRIAKENIIFALGVKLSIMLLSAFGYANMWLAVFADVGVAVIAILNAMRTLIGGKRDEN